MKITKVLIAYDGSECGDAALGQLRSAGLPEKAHAVVLSVVEHWLPPPSSLEIFKSVDYRQEMLTLARRGAAMVGRFKPGWFTEPLVGFGSPAAVILEKADEWGPDLIVVGSHGRTAAGRFLLGSVSQKLAHEARCSVRIARGRPAEPGAPVRLVVGVDGSRGAEAAVSAMAGRLWPRGSEARVVAALCRQVQTTSDPTLAQIAEWIGKENARVTEAAESAVKKLLGVGLTTSLTAKEEDPKRLLLGEAEGWDADSIFVGARGVGRLERALIGSVSSAVAARAHCSVEIVRAT
jgi:nucleotide-binding universal stress UspA family protein